ncbi:MAG: hypothetical protein DRR19_04060 [Candidatus Parabeggiatoa sp. nov. 1]|nr:MAG: hypothetical protein DRR19_04060 [Gammaproteobacteria bacterium]
MNNLAYIYQALGRLEESLPLSEKGYHLTKEILGDKHSSTLFSLNNLTFLYQALGRLNDALPLSKRLYDLTKEVLGEKHPDTLIILNNVAGIYQSLGSLDEALLLLEKNYRLAKNVVGDKHPTTLLIMNHLAVIYQALGNLNDALSLSEKSYPLTKEVMGNKHPYTFKSLNILAFIYLKQDRLDKALPLFENGYHLFKEVLGDKHPDTLKSLSNLAVGYSEQGSIYKAIDLLKTLVKGVEHLRRSDLSAENRQALFKQYTESYTLLSFLYHLSNNSIDAFHTAKMTKARTRLDSMILTLAAQKASLTEKEQQQFQNHHRQITALNHQIAQAAELEKRLVFERQKNQVVKQAANFQRGLMTKYPKEFKQLVAPEIITINEGANLIPSDGLFISYLMLDNHVLVFTLDSTGDLQTHDLGEIAGLEQTLKTYQQLLGEKCTVKKLRSRACGRKYVWQLADGRFFVGKKPSRDKKPKKVKKLGKKLLAPIQDRLHSKPRWIISPDSMLAQIPFETLILEEQPVIAQHEISYVQSLSVLALLKEREKAYQSLKGRETLLAMGAPRYHLPGNRPKKCNQPTRAPDFDVERMLARNANDQQRYQKAFKAKEVKWCNLPGATKELAALEKLFADKRPVIYKQAEASETNLQRLNREQELTRYRYLVFSAHGYFDAQTPELSVIVLDQLNKTPDTDGYITASEWPSYDFKSDLMVLSAC